MNNKFRNAALTALFHVAAGILSAEAVDEETWYNADGEVVKKVKRTDSGAETGRSPDWEPQWVLRERQSSSRVIRYSSGRTSWGRSCYRPWLAGAACDSRFHVAKSRRSGFRGCYHDRGSGGSRWGISCRASGISIRYRD